MADTASNLPGALRALLTTTELPALGPETRNGTQSPSALEAQVARYLNEASLSNTKQELVRSAVLLWHDHLDESHTLSQNIHTSDGSFLHAIMHRREPDAGNSRYWWNRVGSHPCFSVITERVQAVLSQSGNDTLAAKLLPGGDWDPSAFVDACEQARRSGSTAERMLLQQIQQIEFEAFLEHVVSR